MTNSKEHNIFETGMDKTDGIRFKAVCDIFPYKLKYISRRLTIARKHDVTAYESYEEMLANQKSLDAAIIATPDWLHAPMTVACLKAGLHVYCYQQNENVMSIYDYQTDEGSVRAFYQVLNTTCWGTYGQYYETFMGDVGTLLISEFATEKNNGWVCIEDYARSDDAVMQRWNNCIRQKLIGGQFEQPTVCKDKTILVLGDTKVLWPHPLLQTCTEHVHQPHLKNFFDAIRGKASLSCPGQAGYATAVAVLKANDAIKEGKKIEFSPEDFKV